MCVFIAKFPSKGALPIYARKRVYGKKAVSFTFANVIGKLLLKFFIFNCYKVRQFLYTNFHLHVFHGFPESALMFLVCFPS